MKKSSKTLDLNELENLSTANDLTFGISSSWRTILKNASIKSLNLKGFNFNWDFEALKPFFPTFKNQSRHVYQIFSKIP